MVLVTAVSLWSFVPQLAVSPRLTYSLHKSKKFGLYLTQMQVIVENMEISL